MTKFIVIEGIDGSGKTTLSKALEQYLISKEISVNLFQEPTHYESGLKLRNYLQGKLIISPLEELELFIQDRIESVNRNILPSLNKGFLTILDRYYYSTAAYQWRSGLRPEDILQENLNKGFPVPDLIVFLDIPIEIALKRIQVNRGIKEVFESKKELEIVLERYRAVLPLDCLRLDATNQVNDNMKLILARLGEVHLT